jgi:hypothetical protein
MQPCSLLVTLILLFPPSCTPFVFPDHEVFPCVSLPLATPTLRVEVPAGAPWADSNLTAVLLESRDSPLLVGTIAAVLGNMPARARVQVFHSPANARALYAHFLPFINSGKLVPVMLSCSRFEVDSATTSPHFWRAVVGEQVLLFQLDGTLCSGGRGELEGYLSLGYDYIGAPWAPGGFVSHTRAPVGNGGFSLRTRSSHLAVATGWDYHAWYARGLRDSHVTGWSLHEDLFFAHYLPAVGGRVAPAHVAQGFSVETVFHPAPVGAHAFWKHPGSISEAQVGRLLHHCPELLPAWAADTAAAFSFDLLGVDTVVAGARAGVGVGAMPEGERAPAWRRDVRGGGAGGGAGAGGAPPAAFARTALRTAHAVAPGAPPVCAGGSGALVARGAEATAAGACVDVDAGEGAGAEAAPPPIVAAARTLEAGGGGSGSPVGSMTMAWRLGGPVLTMYSSGGGSGNASGGGGGCEEAPSTAHWHSLALALPRPRGAPPPPTAGLWAAPGGGGGGGGGCHRLPALLITLGAGASALDWAAAGEAWGGVPGLRWSRLPAAPSPRRQRFSRGAPPAPLPRLTAARLARAGAPLPWWLPPAAPALPPDLGASEDTALRQLCGVAGADNGTARAVLVVGSAARPVAGAAGRLRALLAPPSALPGRSDWDAIFLGALQPVAPARVPPRLAPLLALGAATVVVARPPGFSGVLELHFPRPPPPPPPRGAAAGNESGGGGGGDAAEALLRGWRASYFPSGVCPPPLAAAGPHPAYLLRPSLHFLRHLNGIRQLSTLTVDTLLHPDDGRGAARPPPPPPPGSAAAAAAAMDVPYADAVEPYGLLPWLCAWPSLRLLVAESPVVASAAAGWAAWAEDEEEAAALAGEGGGGEGGGGAQGGGLAPRLAALIDAAPAPQNPRAIKAIRCARSLLPESCAVEPEWVPPPPPREGA